MSQFLYRDCINWFLSNKSKNIDLEGPWRPKMIADMLASYYDNLIAVNYSHKYEISCSSIDYSNY